MEIAVYNQQGDKSGTVELPDGVFGLKWNGDLVHQVVVGQLANMRPQVAHVKDRSEVRGGGKKPWKQKGTGRARHGSNRSPIWRTGGVTHGPNKNRNTDVKINKKMAKKALYTVLSAKAREGELIVMDEVAFPKGKTKDAAVMFSQFSKNTPYEKVSRGNGVLVALAKKDDTARRALRNLPYAKVDEARNLNAHEVLQYRYFLLPKQAINSL